MTREVGPLRRLRAGRRAADERGVILVWSAIMLTVLLGSAAFAIDVSMWHVQQTRQQKASDAAALAGAVSYPDDPTTSDNAAQDIAKQNGYDSAVTPYAANGTCPLVGNATIRICTGPGDRSDQYQVTVVKQVNNIFGGIFGINTTTIKASATGEYLRPLVMGSPSNQYGNDPDATDSLLTYPNFWGNIAGGNSPKANGDAYAADNCNTITDGCSTSGFGNNLDFNAHGYYYSVTANSAGPIALQAFDPGFVQVGDTWHRRGANLAAASNLGAIPGYPEGLNNQADIHKRFLPVTSTAQTDPGLRYCTGDNRFDTGPAVKTTYQVLKAQVPGDPSSAVQACPPITYPGFVGDVSVPLAAGTTLPGAPAQFSTYFRQWATLCTVDADVGDNYFIELTTDSASSGHNRFALRGVVPNSSTPAEVNIAGNAYMGLYANAGARLTQFYLARVPTAAAGHTLVLNFFDIGDAGSPGTLQVSPPDDSNVGADFSNCQWTGAPGASFNTPSSPWGTFVGLPNCKITGVNVPNNTNWQGQWITVTIPMPANYTCADADPKGCWVTIDYNFTGSVTDTTSWNAYLIGDPVRLVK